VAGSFLLQNRHTLKVELNGEVYAKQGAMAACQGNVEFSFSKVAYGTCFCKLE
jgi:uncharacterized protein (AIM24 family)